MHVAKVFYHDGTVEEVYFESMTYDPEYPWDIDFWNGGASPYIDLSEVSRIELNGMVIIPKVSKRPRKRKWIRRGILLHWE